MGRGLPQPLLGAFTKDCLAVVAALIMFDVVMLLRGTLVPIQKPVVEPNSALT